MSRSVARIVTALLLLPAGPVAAETLYNQDGVQLSATARVIDARAATCRIREERPSADQYEKLKPNEGQPLEVWRVELVVANYSGKALDYLNAHLNVESDWPPCDHWDGPEAHYGATVVWTGPLMSIQDVGTVEPGEEVRETAFVLAWHEEEPTLGRWDINYDFAAGNSAARAGDAPPAERPEVPAASETQREQPPRSLEPESDQRCTASVYWDGRLLDGEERTKTINWTGDCTGGLANGTGEERDMEDNSLPVQEGSYVDGKRNGHWILRNYVSSGEVTSLDEGPYVDGRRHGYWTEWTKARGTEEGAVSEGSYVDGRKHGYWTEREPSGALSGALFVDVSEGPYVDGKRNGHWILRRATRDLDGRFFKDIGGVKEGPYVNGAWHGRWVTRWAHGPVTYDCYSNGEEVDCP